MESFKAATGTDIVHVPYKGGGPMVTDLLGGTVQVVIADQANLIPREGRKAARDRGGGPKRSPPSCRRSATRCLVSRRWRQNGLVGPAGMPPDVVAKLNAAVVR
jgi:tripartite-type tricarboxylate transporter receptor subunit TctC